MTTVRRAVYRLKDRHRELAYRSHRAATFCQQCLEMLEGLSCSIISAHHESRAILAEIAVSHHNDITWRFGLIALCSRRGSCNPRSRSALR